MLPESGASSTPRPIDSITASADYWIARSSRAMTPVVVASRHALATLDFPTRSYKLAHHDKHAFLHPRRRHFPPDGSRQRPVGSEIAARTRHPRPSRLRHRGAPFRPRIRAGAADRGYVSAADHRQAD